MVEKYSKTYHVRSYESDKNGDLRLVTLMNIFQDMADTHASVMGLGIDYCLTHGMAWVGANYHLKIERMPKLHEQIIVDTWPAVEKKLGALRDFVVKGADGQEIIWASSQWILIDAKKKRPLALRANLPQYCVVDGRAMKEEFNHHLETPQRTDFKMQFNVRFDDIDLNNHVNNAVYPLWASEAVPSDFRLGKQICELEVVFKKECHLGEQVVVLSEINERETRHLITAQGDNRELALVRIVWK